MKKRQLTNISHRFGFGAVVSVLLMLVATMTSCSKENDTNSLPDGEYPMTFNASLAEQIDTRATTTNKWDGNEEIAVHIDGEIKKYKAAKDGKLTVANGVEPWYWKNSTDEKEITAWYPYSDAQPTSFTVQADQNDWNFVSYKKSDMVYASKKVKFADRNENVEFKHLPAKVTIQLKAGVGISDIKFATATIENQATTGTINSDGSVPQATSGSTSINPLSASTAPKRILTALVVPQQMQGKVFFKITVEGNTYFYIPRGENDANLKSGSEHKYEITVNRNGISVTGGGPSEWTGDNVGINSEEPLREFNSGMLKIGDYYYADGSYSDGGYRKYPSGRTELIPIKPVSGSNVIGIVYWAGNPSANDPLLKNDCSTCVQALVVSLEEFSNIDWQSGNGGNVQDWLNLNGNRNYLNIRTKHDEAPMNNIQGYNNTRAIENFNNNSANNHRLINIGKKLGEFRAKVRAPQFSSGWYIPSPKEFHLLGGGHRDDIWNNDSGTHVRDVVNQKLKLIGATQLSPTLYWVSAELNDNTTYVVDLNRGSALPQHKKMLNTKTRFILAF